MGKNSKWAKYDKSIKKILSNPIHIKSGYTDLSRLVLGAKALEGDLNILRTYIRRHFGYLKDKQKKNSARVMVYDIETSRSTFKAFWTGKQYVGHKQIKKQPAIISISWKWLGEDKIYDLTWDKDHCDKEMLTKFLPEFNSADMVIGINNKNFDERWVCARAAIHNLEYNAFTKSFDIQKEAKRIYRIPSYSMDYMAKIFDLTHKQGHEGILMWDMIEDGTPAEQKEYLKKMVTYNRGDIVTTEDLYFKLRKYMRSPIHLGVLEGGEKYSCPECGGHNIKLVKTTITLAGTVQRIMKCLDDGVTFKLSNREYTKLMEAVR